MVLFIIITLDFSIILDNNSTDVLLYKYIIVEYTHFSQCPINFVKNIVV